VVTGSANDDTLWANWGNDAVDGLGGTDILDFNVNQNSNSVPAQINVTLTGGASDSVTFLHNDTAPASFTTSVANCEIASVAGGTGNDTLDISASTTALNTVNGNNGDDEITGSPQADWLNGGGNNDTVVAGGGNDTVNVNGGDDQLDGGDGDDFYTVSGGYGIDTIVDGSGTDTADFTAIGNPGVFELGSFTGTVGANVVSSADAIESVVGTTGDDYFAVVPSATIPFSLDGGDGTDTLQYDPSGLTNVVDDSVSTITADSVQTVTYANFESVVVQPLVSAARVWQVFE